MKNVRILFALLLCTSLFYSCTADDITEDTSTTVQQLESMTARDGDTTLADTGDDETDDDDDTPD